MSDLNDLQRKLLDALGLKPEDHIVQVIIDIGPRDFPVVTVKREIWLTKESGPLREVIEEYRLMPRKAADTDATIAYHVGYEAGRRARIDEEGFERTPVQGEFKIEAALKDVQYKEYKIAGVNVVVSPAVPKGTVEFRDSQTGKLQGMIVNTDWFHLTEPEKPRLR